MNASDRAIFILRAGLKKPAPSLRRIETEIHGERKGVNPFAHPNKCEYERWLNDQPFPETHPPSLIQDYKGKKVRATKYGTWVKEHNVIIFNKQFQEWKDKYNATH